MLEKYLERQIDAGVFNQTMFKPNARFGKLFHALVSHKGLPDHAWIDAQPVTAATSEIFRRELIASGILAPLVRRNDDKNRDLRLFVRRTSCEHSKTPCKLCIARRHIEAGFREFPTLWPLRDRFIEQLHCRFYQPEFFCAWQNPLWPLIRVLGEAPLVTHALIDAQPRQYRHQRLIRSELVASGLLPPILEHPGIGRFTAIADEMLSQVGWRNEGDRRLVERYIRMHLLSRLRKSLRGKDDRDIAPVGLVRNELRQVLRLVSVVETEGRTLCNFTKADVRAAWGTRSDGLRLLLQWLAEEGVSEERFIPRRLKRDDGYAGVGTPALRANVNRLLALDAEPSVRLAGILTYCGVFATELALLRASDVLPDGDITIGGKVCHLHGTIAKLTIALRQNLLEEVCGRRPVGWDPWLFAPADAIEGPSGPEILDKLRKIGIDVRSMRSDGQRISLQQPLSAYALDQNLKRSRGMTMERVKVFASEPGAYAILLASEKLKPSSE